jgi:ABC-type sugar transport system substrate-binding protein
MNVKQGMFIAACGMLAAGCAAVFAREFGMSIGVLLAVSSGVFFGLLSRCAVDETL